MDDFPRVNVVTPLDMVKIDLYLYPTQDVNAPGTGLP